MECGSDRLEREMCVPDSEESSFLSGRSFAEGAALSAADVAGLSEDELYPSSSVSSLGFEVGVGPGAEEKRWMPKVFLVGSPAAVLNFVCTRAEDLVGRGFGEVVAMSESSSEVKVFADGLAIGFVTLTLLLLSRSLSSVSYYCALFTCISLLYISILYTPLLAAELLHTNGTPYHGMTF
jgi:hypothetical protein